MKCSAGSRLGTGLVTAIAVLGVAVVAVSVAAASPTAWRTTPNPFAAFIPGPSGASAPNLTTNFDGVLFGVSCVDTQFCFAAGTPGATAAGSLTEYWDGTRWYEFPRSEILSSTLTSISCTSRTFCMAAGYTTNTSPTSSLTTVTEKWDGTKWSVPATPNAALRDNRLDAVSCTSPTSCTAVGGSSDGTTNKTLIENWNGSAWAIVASPDVPGVSNSLAGVSCGPGYLNIPFCVAVGTAGAGAGLGLVLNWHASASWTIASSSTTGSLESVSCVFLSSFCMVGGPNRIARYDGSALTTLPTPAPGAGFHADFPAISCVGSSYCAAAEAMSGPTPAAAFATELTWNGTAWSAASGGVNAGGALRGVSCPTTSFCAAVGGSGVSANGPVAIIGR